MIPGLSATAIQETTLPTTSLIDAALLQRSDYRESIDIALSKPDLSVVDVVFAIFGYRPGWMKAMLILRNMIASLFGLDVSRTRDVLSVQRKPDYVEGEMMFGWTVFVHTPGELIVGRDNTHLDFRVSVLRDDAPGHARMVVSTICAAHNAFGISYLRAVLPFHKLGFRWLIGRARACGRL